MVVPSTILETSNNHKLVKEIILLPVVMDVLEVDIKRLSSANLKMSLVYLETLKALQAMVLADIYDKRKKIKQQGIKIYSEQRNKQSLDAKYVCKGYHHNISLMWNLVRTEVQLTLCRYLGISISGDQRG